MTAGEQENLNRLSEYIKEWREDDRAWKADVSDRLKKLEYDKIARDAVASAYAKDDSESRWKLGVAVGFIGSLSAAATGVVLRIIFNS